MRTVQAVLFDMGGTIETFWRSDELRLAATPGFQEILSAAGIDLHLSTADLSQIINSGMARYYKWCAQTQDELPPQRVWREYVFNSCSMDYDRLDSIAEKLMLYFETHFFHREMRPEMPIVLKIIREMGLKIGLISNIISLGSVAFCLEEYGIREYFDTIVLSSEYGRCKPDPAIFHYAARLANAPTSACVYVGDRTSRDVLGSKRAGYGLSVLIHHKQTQYQDENTTIAMPDAEIDQMTELIDILHALIEQTTKCQQDEKAKWKGKTRAILFDVGDILYRRPHHRRRLKEYLGELGLDYASLPKEKFQALAQQAFLGLITPNEFREGHLRLYGINRPEDIQRGKEALIDDENDIEFFPGVRDTLIELKEKGFLMGIITDAFQPVSRKLSWLELGGLGAVWDSIISSEEVGIRKPDPEIYRVALRQLGAGASEAAFVGHEARELDGAKSVGMQTIAFNYEQAAKADYYLKTFSDLLDVPILQAA
jgi:putative hydrolase of the HAD superfamily